MICLKSIAPAIPQPAWQTQQPRNPAMKFFLDTAEINEIRELSASGLDDGITTNPSLVMKSGRQFVDVVREICEIVPGPVSA